MQGRAGATSFARFTTIATAHATTPGAGPSAAPDPRLEHNARQAAYYDSLSYESASPASDNSCLSAFVAAASLPPACRVLVRPAQLRTPVHRPCTAPLHLSAPFSDAPAALRMSAPARAQ